METEQTIENGTMDEKPDTKNELEYSNEKCAVFWDFENCPPPSGMPGYYVVENLRKVIHRFGSMIALKAYLQITDSTSKKSLRSELQSSGVSLIDCPHNGRKDAADKMILVDMLAFALDTPPPATIVLISGDRDFVYALSTLRNRKYNIVLIVPNKGASIILKSQANMILEWKYDVLNMDDNVDFQNELNNVNNTAINERFSNSTSNLTHSCSYSNITIKTNLSAIEATNKALEKSVVSPGEYPSFPPPQPKGSKSSLSRLSKSFSSNMINSLNNQNMQRCGSQLKYDVETNDNESLSSKNNITFDPALQVNNNTYSDGDYVRDRRLSILSPMVQGYFDLLVEILDHAKMEGNAMPKQKSIKQQLLRKNPFIFERSGLKSFEDYIKSAEKHGIVKIGDSNNPEHAWISLCE
ncbi:DUF537-domain-containing protein [Anaeromyces robustus]|uniref:DUF537-domain-containing protein n=1 Tax=Anaeromyces robustus TaxID=1754192 RepID=A0A1Y1XCM7_9FUNG|nr:DUF537-domain-containing protein [Anaeromyces robustus]|eukprot:ORX83467.1 DUF537-domain-containing protein [Anaeromyces robustus]